MTEYCSVADVTFYIGAGGLTNPQITTQITAQSARIDKILGAQSGSDAIITDLCALMAARTISRKRPDKITLLGTAQDWGNTMKAWDKEIRDTFKMYRSAKGKTSAYQQIDEDTRYSQTAEDVNE